MAAPIRIWFNRNFATSYWLLKQLRENPDGAAVHIFATHADLHSPVLTAADEFELEPDVEGEAYVQWALDFCQRHSIDLLMPRAHQLELAQATDRFAEIGVQVLTPPAETVALFEDKALAYEAAAQAGLPLPPYFTFGSSTELLKAHASLTAQVGSDVDLVIKPAVGVGAQGFRIITPRALSIQDILAEHDPRLRLPQVVDVLATMERMGQAVPKLLLMPRLENPEVSLDTLTSPEGKLLSALPRVKESPRLTRFAEDSNAYWQTQQLHAAHRFAYLANFQFMRWQGRDVLLEVNTRPAGGLFAGEMTGVNYPWEAVRLALGKEPRALNPKLGAAFAQVHFPVTLNES